MRSFDYNGGHWAKYRAHGDIFPLSPSWIQSLAEEAHVDFPRRGLWAAEALNSLAMQVPNSKVEAMLHGVPPNQPQIGAASRIVQCFKEAGEAPVDLGGKEALQALGNSDNLYTEEPSSLAAYSFEKVKVLHSELRPRPLATVVPQHTKALLERASTFIMKSPDEIRQDGPCPIKPYWDPLLRRSSKELIRLMVRLANQGLVSFRDHIKETVGLFCVKKKTPEWVRLIVDARRVNYINKPPPTTRLATPRSYLDIVLPPQGERPQGYGIEADVNDCFYNFINEPTASMFGIDYPMTVKQWVDAGWQRSDLYSDSLQRFYTPGDDLVVYPVFRGLCMGWAWALYFAQQAVSHIACGRVERPLSEVRDKTPAPDISQQPCVGVYVDNIAIVGLELTDVKKTAQQVERFFTEANIPLTWSTQEPQRVFQTVGMVIDFEKQVIRNKPSRLWRAFLAGREILKHGRIAVKVLERWLGHMTAIFMIAPHGLSCFFHIYKFIAENRDRRAFLWNSVRQEMRLALGVMWLARASMTFQPVLQVDVGDSSSTAFALMTTWATSQEVAELIRWREAWRYCPLPEPVKEAAKSGNREELLRLLSQLHEGRSDMGGTILRPGIPWGAGLLTQYAQWLVDSTDDSSWLRTSAVRSQLRAKPSRKLQVDIPSMVQPVPSELCNRGRYSLLWRKRWRHTGSHINIKEARVTLSSLKRTARVKSLHEHLKVTLTDNLASLCALERGRSSSFPLNVVCRTAAAYQFGSGVRWRLRHVRSGR
eukprot:s872_g5.t1